ncbi:MAG: RDD family protein [Chloroflexota bacterium]
MTGTKHGSASHLPPLATIGARYTALVIDVVVFYFGMILVTAILYLMGLDVYEGLALPGDDETIRGENVLGLLMLVAAAVLYFAWLPARFYGQTPGKRLNGIRIITVDGEVPTFSRLVLRNTIGYILSYWLFYMGFALALRDEQKRTLHDNIARTRVVIADRKDKP